MNGRSRQVEKRFPGASTRRGPSPSWRRRSASPCRPGRGRTRRPPPPACPRPTPPLLRRAARSSWPGTGRRATRRAGRARAVDAAARPAGSARVRVLPGGAQSQQSHRRRPTGGACRHAFCRRCSLWTASVWTASVWTASVWTASVW